MFEVDFGAVFRTGHHVCEVLGVNGWMNRAECSCGYRGRLYERQSTAIGQAIRHVEAVRAERCGPAWPFLAS